MINNIILWILGIVLGICIDQAKVCRIMAEFFKEQQYHIFDHSKEFWDGVLYLNDYINEYYNYKIRKKDK